MNKYENIPKFSWFAYASFNSIYILLEIERNEDTAPLMFAGLVAKESA